MPRRTKVIDRKMEAADWGILFASAILAGLVLGQVIVWYVPWGPR